MTESLAHKWPGTAVAGGLKVKVKVVRCQILRPAVRKVAEEWPDEHGEIVGGTPYSLRRGVISLRIRAGEDRPAIAKQCGTSA